MAKRRKQRPGQIGDYWISLRPNSPIYCRTWFDPISRQTRRASLGTTDLHEAEIELARWITVNGRLHQERPADVPLETVLVRYWERHGRKVAMAASLRANLGYWSTYFPGATVGEVTVSSQHEFVDWLKAKRVARTGEPYSSSYVKKIVAAGAAALRDAHQRGQLTAIPPLVQVKEHRPQLCRLEVGGVATLLDAIQTDHLYMFVMLALNTLSRPGALFELHREQCSLVDRLIFLNPPGREQTRKFRPVVPITETLYPLIKDASPGLLVHWRGKPVRQIDRVWRETIARAGLGAGVDRMTLRRTMARELRRRGVQPWDLGGIMGHKAKDHDTTEIYAAYDPNYLAAAVAAIDGFMSEIGRVAARPIIRSKHQERSSCVLVPFPEGACPQGKAGAGEGTRTLDIQLGKLSFYL
jgi:integrase